MTESSRFQKVPKIGLQSKFPFASDKRSLKNRKQIFAGELDMERFLSNYNSMVLNLSGKSDKYEAKENCELVLEWYFMYELSVDVLINSSGCFLRGHRHRANIKTWQWLRKKLINIKEGIMVATAKRRNQQKAQKNVLQERHYLNGCCVAPSFSKLSAISLSIRKKSAHRFSIFRHLKHKLVFIN